MSTRNFKDFREQLLAALGSSGDHDVENEINFKNALLDALKVEHTMEDVRNFEQYREKLIEGVAKSGGVTVEALNVTENGTYSEEGKAYSPVVVDVESDFTTAEVTIINSTNAGITQSCIAVLEYLGAEAMISQLPPLDPEASLTVDMVLFKGSQIIYAPEDLTIAVTGDITDDSGELTITGAGTITYTAK